MPTDSNGNYALPGGYLAVAGTTILPSEHNPPLEDVGAGLTGRLMRNGAGAMTGQLKSIDGTVGAPGITFGSALSTGFYKTANGVGVSVSGALVAEFGASGILSGVVTGSIADKAVTPAKLFHPSVAARLLGSNANAALAVTGAANNGSGLIRLTVASSATFATGQKKTVSDVVGTTEANGTWTITVVDATHIDLQGSAFANAYVSGGTIGGGVDELKLGTGLSMAGDTVNAAAVAGPMSGAQGLVITNNVTTPNSKIDITADQTTMITGAGVPIFASGVSITIDSSTVGAANGLDTGARGNSTWYNLFLISNGTTTAGLASLSATAPTLPSGYTYSVRVGAMITDSSGNFMRTKQLGKDAQYVVAAGSNTLLPPVIANGVAGTWSATSPTLAAAGVASFVPPTATKISVLATQGWKAGTSSNVLLAPNAAWGGSQNGPGGSNGVVWPANNAQGETIMLLESTNVYWASNAAGGAIVCFGWTDKINAT